MVTRSNTWIVVASLLWVAPAQAAPLTLEQAVTLALARAPEVAAAEKQRQATAAKVDQARSAYLPRFSAGATYLAWWPRNELPIDLSAVPLPVDIAEIDDYHHFRAGLDAGIRVFDLARGPRVDAAREAESADRAAIEEAQVKLAFQVRATFLAALFSRDVKRIAGASLKLARAQEKRALLRAEVGTGSQIALAQSRVRVAQLAAQLHQADSELERHRRQLASLLGLKQLPELEGDLQALSQTDTPSSLDGSPTLARLRASREAARLSARSTARTLVPTVDLFAKAEVEYPHRMRLEWGPLLQGGVKLSWPFFEGGVRWSRLREARARSEALQAAEQGAREQLGRRLIDLGSRARTAEGDLASAKETLKQTEVYLRVARAAVAAGTGTDLDVHQAELGVDQARIAVRKALLSLALVRAEALAVCGVAQRGAKS